MQSLKRFLFIALAVTAGCIFGTGSAFAQTSKPKTSTSKSDTTGKYIYTCTMHPEVMTEKPGKCPKCGMTLVKKKVDKVYTCTMDPEVISDKPGNCPKCGMTLVEKKSTSK
jgi:transcription initiation factor IIE alpha subunit